MFTKKLAARKAILALDYVNNIYNRKEKEDPN